MTTYNPYGDYRQHCSGCRCYVNATSAPYIGTTVTYGPRTLLFAEWDDAIRFARGLRSSARIKVSKADGEWQVAWTEPHPFTWNTLYTTSLPAGE